MEDQVYALQYRVEKDHWWFSARQKILIEFLERRFTPSPSLRLLDVGCGTGAMLELLSQRYDAQGIDVSEHAAAFCRARGLHNVRVGTLTTFPKGEAFDIVTMLDVVEHIEEDVQVLRDAHAIVKPGGHLLVTVPAFPSLWSHHDVMLHHKRRYTRSELRAVVAEAGFIIDRMTFFNTLLFPVALVKRSTAKLTGSREANDLEIPSRFMNSLLKTVFGMESRVVSGGSLPFGLSLLCWARKA